MGENRAGIKVTFSVPEEDVSEVRKIIRFCKKHRIPYSPVLVRKLKEWYTQNYKNIQEMLYKPNKEPT